MTAQSRLDEILKWGWNALHTGEQFIHDLNRAGVDERTLKSLEEYLIALEMIDKKERSGEEDPLTTQIRDLLEDCYGWGVKLRLRMETAFGRSSEKFQSFPSKALSKGRRHLTVMEEAMERMLDVAKSHHHMLKEHGQTDEEITVGENLHSRLVDKRKKARFLQISSGEEQKEDLFAKILESAGAIKKAGEDVFQDQPEVQEKFHQIHVENRNSG